MSFEMDLRRERGEKYNWGSLPYIQLVYSCNKTKINFEKVLPFLITKYLIEQKTTTKHESMKVCLRGMKAKGHSLTIHDKLAMNMSQLKSYLKELTIISSEDDESPEKSILNELKNDN